MAEAVGLRESTSPAVWGARHLRIAADAAGIALWSWNVDTDEIALDENAHQLWALPLGAGMVTFEALSSRIHPEDLDRVRAAFTATREILGPYEVDFRIIHGRDIRWISARGRGDDEGIVGRIMFGVFLDVTGRKLAEEGRELLSLEMSRPGQEPVLDSLRSDSDCITISDDTPRDGPRHPAASFGSGKCSRTHSTFALKAEKGGVLRRAADDAACCRTTSAAR